MHPCIISQINPTGRTILFNTFIYVSSLHVSAIHVPIIRRKLLYLCDIGVCHSVCVASFLLVGLKIQPATGRQHRGCIIPQAVTHSPVINFRFQLMHYNFISLIILLYMFRAPMCPSSGASTIHSQLVQCHLKLNIQFI